LAGDEIDADVGDAAENIVVGKKNRQASQRSDPRQTVNVDSSSSNDGWIRNEILSHGAQIRELAYRLDDIPNKFQALQADVKKLQDVEITVRPDTVVIKPVTTPPQSLNLSMRALLVVLIVALFIVIVLVGLLYWQVANAGGV
jgi:hypothetical protein